MILRLSDRSFRILDLVPASPGWKAFYATLGGTDLASADVLMWASVELPNADTSWESHIIPVVYDPEEEEMILAPVRDNYVGLASEGDDDAVKGLEAVAGMLTHIAEPTAATEGAGE